MPPPLAPITRPGILVSSPSSHAVPATIAAGGEQASWRYIEFFTANIRNANTRRAYARACSQFFAWCEDRGLTLTTIRPFNVSEYIETLQKALSAPSVKQQLAAVRMLFDWLITGQVVPINPASAVRGPKHVVKTGKTPVLDATDWRKLLASIPTETVRGPAGPCADRHPHLFLRAHHGCAQNEGGGSSAARCRLAAPAARERRQASHHAVPSCARRGAARLHRRGRHR
jgi:hypothetical protein